MRIGAWRRNLAVWSSVLVLAAGCGGGEEAPAEEGAAAAGEREAAPAVDLTTVGTLRGRVAFEGTPPAPEPIDMSEEPACADAYGEEGPTTEEVVVQDGGLANVFVYVKEGLAGEFPAPSDPVTLDQQGCRYHPHVLGIQVGQPLRITNSDPLLHNINAKPVKNRGFNISQPQAGMETTRTFRVPEVMIPVECDVHGWMSAYLGVVEHPYFGVSGPGGTFEIPNLPPGEYTLEAWHERYGTQTANVSIAAQETTEVVFQFSASQANADVPLGDPLVVKWRSDGSATVERRSAKSGAGR